MNVIKKLAAILSIALIAGLGIFGVSRAINAQETQNENTGQLSEQAAFAKQAAVSKGQAQAVALKNVAGDVLHSELEREHGRAVYCFDIRAANGKVFDVEVDAKTGAFVKATADDGDEEKGETSERDEQNETEND